jgi:hypothetical protein
VPTRWPARCNVAQDRHKRRHRNSAGEADYYIHSPNAGRTSLACRKCPQAWGRNVPPPAAGMAPSPRPDMPAVGIPGASPWARQKMCRRPAALVKPRVGVCRIGCRLFWPCVRSSLTASRDSPRLSPARGERRPCLVLAGSPGCCRGYHPRRSRRMFSSPGMRPFPGQRLVLANGRELGMWPMRCLRRAFESGL